MSGRHEHHVTYDLLMDRLWCPGCGKFFMSGEWLEYRGIWL